MRQRFFHSVEEFIIPIIILVVSFTLAWIFNKVFAKYMLKHSQEVNNDPTNYKFLRHSITAAIYLLGIGFAIYSIDALRAIATSILAGAGIMAVAIGFASQQALSNIISGIFIVIYKPFGINNRIEINGLFGVVEDITLRHTVIRNFENKRIVIPNSKISEDVIINSDLIEELICRHIVFGISYESDVDKAKSIIKEVAIDHPLSIDNRTPEQIQNQDDKVAVRVIGLGDSSVDIKAWVWANNQPEAFMMGCDILENVKKRFDKEGIEIPYPHRTIVQKK